MKPSLIDDILNILKVLGIQVSNFKQDKMSYTQVNEFRVEIEKMVVTMLVDQSAKTYNKFQVQQKRVTYMPKGKAQGKQTEHGFNFLSGVETPTEFTPYPSDRRCLVKLPKNVTTITEAQVWLDNKFNEVKAQTNGRELYIAETFMLNPRFIKGLRDGLDGGILIERKVYDNHMKKKEKGTKPVSVDYNGKMVHLFSYKEISVEPTIGKKLDFDKCEESIKYGVVPIQTANENMSDEEIAASLNIGEW